MPDSSDTAIHTIAREIRERVNGLKLSDANEAETRFKLIDDIVRNLLGWTVADIHPEERIAEDGKTRFIDYVLRTANTAIVIEAKRIGTTFEIPELIDRRVQLTAGFVKGDLGDAVIQARDYGRAKSIPFAVATNGYQWIIFPASRADQVEFNKSSAIVFDSLEVALGSEIEYFLLLLSRDSVADNVLEHELLGRTADQLQERRLRNIVQAEAAARPTNPIYPLIENEVIDCFADTITGKDKDFLELCYVLTPDRMKFDNRIRMHLRKKNDLFSTHVARPLRVHESPTIKRAIENFTKKGRPLALLVLGTVGAGKTTYLNHTRQLVANLFFTPRLDSEYPHWIYVDFRTAAENRRPIEVIYEAIFSYIKSDIFFSTYERGIRSAYDEEIESLKRGPLSLIARSEEEFNKRLSDIIMSDYQKVVPYVDKLIAYASSKQPIFLIVDNVDQFESEAFQGQVFADAIAFASKFSVNLVLAMRETTFVRHRNDPSFDAFDFDPLSIEPPEISAVLSRRFKLLHKSLERKPGAFLAENGAHVEVEDMSVFASLIQESVLGTEVGGRIEILANKDIRLALRMTREFLERGYTDPGRAISFHRQNQKYVMPRHEAFRAILLGNQNVYSEAFATIGNPFDARLSRSSSQLLRLFVLSALVRYSSDATAEYVEGTAARDVCRKLGYGDVAVKKVLTDLCTLRFCQTASYEAPTFVSIFFPTRLGGYIVRELLAEFTFVETVMMDTFIAHDGLWENLKDSTKKISKERDMLRRIELRIGRVRGFWKNLSDQYHLLVSEAIRRGLPSEWCTNPFSELEKTFEQNCQRVLTSAKQHYIPR